MLKTVKFRDTIKGEYPYGARALVVELLEQCNQSFCPAGTYEITEEDLNLILLCSPYFNQFYKIES